MERPSGEHAVAARALVEQAGLAMLSTLALDPPGYPFGSLVSLALDEEGNPLLLLSDLAEHVHNLRQDPRASVLAAEHGAGDPLALARVTLLGRLGEVTGEARASGRAAYLARHPEAARYADFKDFRFYRMQVEVVRYVGGFGRMSWVDPAAYAKGSPG